MTAQHRARRAVQPVKNMDAVSGAAGREGPAIRGEGDEPNDSANPGDPLPNQVLAEDFCVVGEWPTVILSERCR